MTDAIGLLIGTALVNNIVLSQFLGLCPFMGVTQRSEAALGMAAATGFVLVASAAICHALYFYLLLPNDLAYLRVIAFIVAIAGFVQMTELIVRARYPRLQQQLGVYLPLITTNCAVLGVALLNLDDDASWQRSMARAVGAAAGFAAVLVLFAGVRERLELADLPAALRGPPIAFFTVAILAMAFMGFVGIDVRVGQ